MATKEQIKWVNEWFEACKDKNLKPWEWDFKRFYCKEYEQPTNDNITFWNTYKNEKLEYTPSLNITKLAGKNADCDKEALFLYQIIWGNVLECDKYKVIRGETINSFRTTHNKFNDLIKDKNKLLNNELNKFARNTHCIGNFIIIPYWMNNAKSAFSKDYSDMFFHSLSDFLNSFGHSTTWKEFVKCYYLQPYVENDFEYSVSEFWEGHFKNATPKNSEHIAQFLKFVNPAIEERGKWLIKLLCEKCRLTSYDFYDEIKDMDRPPFSSELK